MSSSSNATTRRSFLTLPAATAAAFTIVRPELVKGWGDEKLKIGLIGCGVALTVTIIALSLAIKNYTLRKPEKLVAKKIKVRRISRLFFTLFYKFFFGFANEFYCLVSPGSKPSALRDKCCSVRLTALIIVTVVLSLLRNPTRLMPRNTRLAVSVMFRWKSSPMPALSTSSSVMSFSVHAVV